MSVLESMIDDLQWDIDKIRKREQRLNRHLAEVLERASDFLFIAWRLESFCGVCPERMDLGSSSEGQADSCEATVVTRLQFWAPSLRIFVLSVGEFERLQGLRSREQSLWWHHHHQCEEGEPAPSPRSGRVWTWCLCWPRRLGLCSPGWSGLLLEEWISEDRHL